MSLLLFLLVFSGHCSAAALTTATPNVFLHQREALVTRFLTIFFSGDPSQSRTAEIGFDCRVDLDRSLWGFCPTSVFVVSDCGLAGNCVDRHACSRGCGKGAGLTTFTCTGSNGEFCTTAELYLTNNIGPFSYIGCGGGPTTDRYSAFTTNPTTRTTAALSTPTPSAPRTSPPLTSSPTTFPTQDVNQTGIGANTTSITPASTTGTAAGSIDRSPNNTGAIIGGVIGCLALICVSSIAVVWLLRRHRHKVGSKRSSVQGGSASRAGPRQYDPDAGTKLKYPVAGWGPQELDQNPTLFAVGELGGPKSPVELPAVSPYHGTT